MQGSNETQKLTQRAKARYRGWVRAARARGSESGEAVAAAERYRRALDAVRESGDYVKQPQHWEWVMAANGCAAVEVGGGSVGPPAATGAAVGPGPGGARQRTAQRPVADG